MVSQRIGAVTRRGRPGLYAAVAAALLSFAAPAEAALYQVKSTVLEGLSNPRGLTIGPDGALYVAEAGTGGSGPSLVNGAGTTVFYGATGSISRYRDGVQELVIGGLPSLAGAGGAEATGVHDIAFGPGGTLYALFGWGADPALRSVVAGESGAELFGQIAAFGGGGFTPFADLGQLEAADNPDGTDVNSNPYSLVATPDGFVASDAGGNTLITIGATGTAATLAVLPAQPNPLPFGPPVYQTVPTGVASSAEGELVAAELTGFPFPVGGADVYTVAADGSATSRAGGFTNLIDVAFGPDGTLYALELDSDSLLGPAITGSLFSIDDLGVKTLLLSGLISPTALAVGPDGRIFVVEDGLSASMARVVELTPVPVPPALPLMAAGLGLVAFARRRARARA